MKQFSVNDILLDKESFDILLVRQFTVDSFGQSAALCATTEQEAVGTKVKLFTTWMLFRRCIKLGALLDPTTKHKAEIGEK